MFNNFFPPPKIFAFSKTIRKKNGRAGQATDDNMDGVHCMLDT